MKKITLTLLFGFLLVGLYRMTTAQGTLSIPGQINNLEEQISLKVSPQVPEAGKPVELTVNAYGTDISKAKITWKVNGVVATNSVSINTLSVNMGEIGKAVTVEVLFQPFNGPLVSKKITLIPGEIDLIWETDGYNPPFYKGKTFYGPEKNVRIVAIPNIYDAEGKKMNTGSLDFKWSKNREIEGSASGLGKNIWQFNGWILLKPIEIEVTAGTENKVRGKKSFSLEPIFSEIRIYENSPVYGTLFNISMRGDKSLQTEEQTFEAYPFSIGASTREDAFLKYTWYMNGKVLYGTSNKPRLTVRNEKNEDGAAQISAKMDSSLFYFDQTSALFKLNFTKKDFEF